MPLMTIVQDYITAAFRRARVDELEDGTLVATSPDLPGIIAYGVDVHECARQMYLLIDDTLRLWLGRGYEIPVIDGIDLNSEKGRVLATYHRHAETARPDGEFYEDEAATEAALEGKTPA